MENIKNRAIGAYWQGKRAVHKALFGVDVAPAIVTNPLLKWPRNFKCVCGSGKKFKSCCLKTLARNVTAADAIKINEKLDKHRV